MTTERLEPARDVLRHSNREHSEKRLLQHLCAALCNHGVCKAAWVVVKRNDGPALEGATGLDTAALSRLRETLADGSPWDYSQAGFFPAGEDPLGPLHTFPLALEPRKDSPHGLLALHTLTDGISLADLQDLALWLGLALDCSRLRRDRHWLKQRLRASGHVSQIVDHAADGLLALDGKGRVRFANHSAQRLLHRSNTDLIGHELGLPVKSEQPTEVELPTEDGGSVPVEVSVTPFGPGTSRGYAVVLRDISDRRKLEQTRQDFTRRLHGALLQAIEAIARTVETRDPYTAGHQRRVARLAHAIAQRLGLPPDRAFGVLVGGLIHDLGKIHIPAEILTRPGRLTPNEFALVREHCRAGEEIIHDVEFPWPLGQMILQHHERMDGSGYPQGLRGDDILLEARILAVADVVESIASHRPYRPALGVDRALEEIQAGRGTLLDADAVDACLALFREGYDLNEQTTDAEWWKNVREQITLSEAPL
jgi:HD-GYP domain-containing protein (c-di-GMP phosphodiesterase class II)